MKNIKLPNIFIFDIDNCIIGNIKYQIIEYEFLELIKTNCESKYINKECLKKINFVKNLKQGLLRPYFKEFIKFIKKKYKNVEIYVYTNSTYTWTHNGLVSNIEKASNIKFNKPYFTRENSNMDMSKSLLNVYKIIINKLKYKYPKLNEKKNILEVFNNRLIFIDNIRDNLADYPNKQLTCPDYNYTKPYNIISKLKRKYNIKNKILKDLKIENFIRNTIEIPYIDKKINNKKYKKDKKIEWNYIKMVDTNVKKDTFFLKLIKIMKKKDNKLNIENIKDFNTKFLFN